MLKNTQTRLKELQSFTIRKVDGDINDENNYHPISVIAHQAKMVESLVSYQIIDFLESHSFISMDQSAYLKKHKLVFIVSLTTGVNTSMMMKYQEHIC